MTNVTARGFNFKTAEVKSWDQVKNDWKDCTKCNQRRHRKKVTHGVGNTKDPDVIFIGQYPTELELETGIPFQGKGGSIIRQFIRQAGIPENKYYLTNTTKCPPLGKKASPKECIDACSPYLDAEIDALKPKLIVAMGVQAMKRMLLNVKPKPKNLDATRSSVYDYNGIPLIIVANPAAVFRYKDIIDKTQKEEVYKEDLNRLGAVYRKFCAPVDTHKVTEFVEKTQVPETTELNTTIDKAFQDVLKCNKCSLGSRCKNRVFGQGKTNSKIMIVGMAPGRDEDELGLPFIGPAGQELDRAITAAAIRDPRISRQNAYITNTLKCRPTDNNKDKDRNPTQEEMASCEVHLERQIRIVKPKVMLVMGSTTIEHIIGVKKPKIGQLQGKVFPHKHHKDIKVVVAWHPSYLIRNPHKTNLFKDLVACVSKAFTIAHED